MPIAAIDLDGLEQFVVTYYKDQNGLTTIIDIRTITDNDGNLINQHIHKASGTKDIAKGNVIVFESYQQNNDYENMKIIRNEVKSKLTKRELMIYNKQKRVQEDEKNDKEEFKLAYGGNPKGDPNQYESQPFKRDDTKTFDNSLDIKPLPLPNSITAKFNITSIDQEKIINEKEISKELNPIVDFLNDNPDKKITLTAYIMGYNGMPPLKEADIAKILKKAEAVKSLLVSRGGNANQIEIVSGGAVIDFKKVDAVEVKIK
jgi:outer membrane protein OmpA-like peptidoglycan-associated protein